MRFQGILPTLYKACTNDDPLPKNGLRFVGICLRDVTLSRGLNSLFVFQRRGHQDSHVVNRSFRKSVCVTPSFTVYSLDEYKNLRPLL